MAALSVTARLETEQPREVNNLGGFPNLPLNMLDQCSCFIRYHETFLASTQNINPVSHLATSHSIRMQATVMAPKPGSTQVRVSAGNTLKNDIDRFKIIQQWKWKHSVGLGSYKKTPKNRWTICRCLMLQKIRWITRQNIISWQWKLSIDPCEYLVLGLDEIQPHHRPQHSTAFYTGKEVQLHNKTRLETFPSMHHHVFWQKNRPSSLLPKAINTSPSNNICFWISARTSECPMWRSRS